LLNEDSKTPMFVINGADDIHVPEHDTLVFRGRRNTEVEMMEGTGHCAVSKWDEMLGKVIAWLSDQMASQGRSLPAVPLT
jgi:esterase FrsA